jgi:hypothetical protein
LNYNLLTPNVFRLYLDAEIPGCNPDGVGVDEDSVALTCSGGNGRGHILADTRQFDESRGVRRDASVMPSDDLSRRLPKLIRSMSQAEGCEHPPNNRRSRPSQRLRIREYP